MDIGAKLIAVQPNRTNLVAEIGQGHPILGISGHMDVVDAGDLKQWQSDPYHMTEQDGRLYGRGASDMKSGLAAMITAMIEIKENSLLPKGTIRLLVTIGEEVGELGSKQFVKDGYMKDVDALVIGEPSNYLVAYAHKGSMDVHLQSVGKAAHSSRPEEGYNAIDPLIELLDKANHHFRTTNQTNDLLGSLTFNTTIINGGNQVNSIPEAASAEINIRTVPEFNNEQVTKELTALVADQNQKGAYITMDIYMSQPSIETTGKSPLVSLAQNIGKKYLQKNISADGFAPVTDASNLVRDKGQDYLLIIFGPGNDSVHKVNEYVDKTTYLQFHNIYRQLFIEYLNL